MSSDKAFDELLQKLQSRAANVGDIPQVPEKPERLQLYNDLISVGSLLAVYGNIFTDKILQDSGEANVITPSGISPQWYKYYVHGMYQALKGPLASYFNVPSMTNGHVSKQVDMKEVKQVGITDVFEDVVVFFGEFTSGKTELKTLLDKFTDSVTSIDLNNPASSLPRESMCIKMNVLVKKTLSGSAEPVDKDDEIYQPTLKVTYADILLKSLKSSAQDQNQVEVKDSILQIETQYELFEAELDDNSYRRDKARLDGTLEEIMKKNWDLSTQKNKGD
ncbi:MAG: hypothetical protein M1831_004785 [Alyxoria varia]|nr:MAG: hypothetical protein M1831_004785 [Alyxoria varia]